MLVKSAMLRQCLGASSTAAMSTGTKGMAPMAQPQAMMPVTTG